MLIGRGARVHSTNMGDDTPLHLAAAHGNRDIVLMLLKQKAEVNFVNEHGNSALHYATFWNFPAIGKKLTKKLTKNLLKIDSKSTQNRLKIDSKSTQNRLKID